MFYGDMTEKHPSASQISKKCEKKNNVFLFADDCVIMIPSIMNCNLK